VCARKASEPIPHDEHICLGANLGRRQSIHRRVHSTLDRLTSRNEIRTRPAHKNFDDLRNGT
ncbi:16858_t:CDS:1, partial [Acaulospora colombiana]